MRQLIGSSLLTCGVIGLFGLAFFLYLSTGDLADRALWAIVGGLLCLGAIFGGTKIMIAGHRDE